MAQEPEESDGERLQKVLARAGFGSRRVCEDIIVARRVMVNGDVAVLGRRIDLENDSVQVDGVDIPLLPDLTYYLLNKPVDVVVTADDPHGRPTALDFLPDEPRVFSVGRLDYDSEGLLLLTNDGQLTQRLTHPSFGVEKEYLAEVIGVPSPRALRLLRTGVELSDGITAPAKVIYSGGSSLKIAIHEGRNRQVRRMCEVVGHPVKRLVRVRIGNLADRNLKPGAWRTLTTDEVRGLYESSAEPVE